LPSMSDARLQHDYLNYLKWTEPLALMLELVESEEQAVRVVRLALEVDLRLGARLAGAVKYGFQEMTVELLIREIDKRKIPKLYAIELFKESKSVFAADSLIANLKDFNSDVRRTAAGTLVKVGNEKYANIIIIYDIKDSVSEVLWEAAAEESLDYIGNEKAVDASIIALDVSVSDVLWKVAETLGNIDNEKAVTPLILALDLSVSNVLWEAAAEPLGKIGNDEAVNALIIALKDSNSDIRREAAWALGKISNDEAVNALIIALKDSDDYVRRKAAEALVNIDNEKAFDALIIALKDSDYNVRRKVAEALVNIAKSDRNLPTLTQQLPHLVTLIPTEASQQALSVITAIQSRCKYYNYAIAQMTLPPEDKANPTKGNTTTYSTKK